MDGDIRCTDPCRKHGESKTEKKYGIKGFAALSGLQSRRTQRNLSEILPSWKSWSFGLYLLNGLGPLWDIFLLNVDISDFIFHGLNGQVRISRKLCRILFPWLIFSFISFIMDLSYSAPHRLLSFRSSTASPWHQTHLVQLRWWPNCLYQGSSTAGVYYQVFHFKLIEWLLALRFWTRNRIIIWQRIISDYTAKNNLRLYGEE